MKKITSIFLVTVMLLSVFGIVSFAETSDDLEAKYIQISNVQNDKYTVRFVGLTSLSENSVIGVTIKVWQTAEGTTLANFSSADYTSTTPTKIFTTDACTVYNSLDGHDVKGIKSYSAGDYGADNFFAATVDNIPTGNGYYFEITPSYGSEVGNTQKALFNENGVCLNTTNFADTVYWDQADEEPQPPTVYTAMSINAGAYANYDSSLAEGKMEILVDYINTQKPDSIAVQEYGSKINSYFNTSKLTGYSEKYFNYTDSKLGSRTSSNMPFFYNSNKYTVRDGEGGCISIWPGTYGEKTGDPTNPFSFSWIVLRDKTTEEIAYIHANLHLDSRSTGHEKISQAQKINEELDNIFEEYPNAPVVISGDYNTRITENEGIFDTLIGEHPLENAIYCADVAEDVTQQSYHNFGNSTTEYAIDHALVNENVINVKKHDIVTESEWQGMISASDHYPLIITFTVNQ